MLGEALAEGMTVVDYAPNSPATEDFKTLANWIRTIAPPSTAGLRGLRWSER
jgi:MinD-like ATPase involved in chromosome partitioning or flagellar assembly